MAGESGTQAMRIFRLIGVILAFALLSISSPAAAHKKHRKEPAPIERVAPAPAPPTTSAAQTDHARMGEMMGDEPENRSSMPMFARLLDWLGRLHPIIVHFPIAFFPAALFTAVVGRRRPAFAAPVQFLVVAGGIIAPIAALLGWLDAMAADAGPLLTVHRWLGTAIGVGALGLGIWAWRRPEADRSNGMIVALTVLTAAIIVQGWFGGAMVHGIDHLSW